MVVCRTVIVDNNTWNNTHIAAVGRAMSSPERKAWHLYRELDVDYVLVVFGGFIGSAHPRLPSHSTHPKDFPPSQSTWGLLVVLASSGCLALTLLLPPSAAETFV